LLAGYRSITVYTYIYIYRKIIDTREKLKQEQRQLTKNLEFEKKKVEEINVKYLV
jgi:hypothetical protein